MSDTLNDIDTYQKADEIMRIFRSAVSEAQAENRRLGIPNVYVINGIRYFELPDGEITRTPPAGWDAPREE